jgi:16S rRNA (guanine966-N2)-methyltransferase
MSQPRIIGGKARGIRLDSVPGDSTRPVTDRVKEALFNILSGDIVDATFLDLFGGTGSIGIEALSRGASYCRFIELNARAVATIKENLKRTHTENAAKVHNMDALKFLTSMPGESYDYIYIAPPQYKGIWLQALETVDQNLHLLSTDGWVIVQIHPIEYLKPNLAHLVEFDQRKYGSTLLVFFQRSEI